MILSLAVTVSTPDNMMAEIHHIVVADCLVMDHHIFPISPPYLAKISQ